MYNERRMYKKVIKEWFVKSECKLSDKFSIR